MATNQRTHNEALLVELRDAFARLYETTREAHASGMTKAQRVLARQRSGER